MGSPKSTKKPGSVRYLLSADRKLQRLSLKRLAARVKKAGDPPRSSRPKRAAAAKPSPAKTNAAAPRPWGWGARAFVLGLFGMVTVGAMMAAGDSSSPSPADTPAAQAPASPTFTAPTAKPTAKAPAEQKVKARPLAESTTKPAPVAPAPATKPADEAAVTITGCLQQDAKTFWLKDASGAEAPKSRSWRSGFLKRNSSRVDVAGAADALKLSTYVGQRVAATGVLTDRTLRTHSVRRIAASCN